MKRKALVLLAAAVAVALLAGCSLLFPTVVGSRSLVSSGYGFTGYNRVTASQTFTVSVIADTAYSVQVTCDDNVINHLIVRQVGTAIELSLEQGFNYVGVTASAVVHMPALTGLDLSGATRAVVDPGFSSTGPLSVSVSGASVANLKGHCIRPGDGRHLRRQQRRRGRHCLHGAAVRVRCIHGRSQGLRGHRGGCVDERREPGVRERGIGRALPRGERRLDALLTGSPALQLRDLSGTSRIVKL